MNRPFVAGATVDGRPVGLSILGARGSGWKVIAAHVSTMNDTPLW